MAIISTVAPEIFSEIFRKMKENQPVPESVLRKNVIKPGKTTDCKFAEDTGTLAIQNRPCKGNKIICHHPDNDGMMTYAKLCNKPNCKFYTSSIE